MSNVADHLHGKKKNWYEVEKNTANLVSAAVASRSIASLSGDGIWNLIRLTWITQAKSHDHWKKLKAPALAELWGRPKNILSDLSRTIVAMNLPPDMATAAANRTGMVNFYNKRRNSSRHWCHTHRTELRAIIKAATQLRANDEGRVLLATRIDQLPSVPPPSGAVGNAAAGALLTPLLACLDPQRRFPIINGRRQVRQLLQKLGLANTNLTHQVTGMIGLIGQYGIADAFMIDVLAEQIATLAAKMAKVAVQTKPTKPGKGHGSSLPYFDDDEREALQEAKNVVYRNRHNKMTNALRGICKGLKRGDQQHCRYDALIENYEGTGRDLLLEVKPDPDKGAIRVAIGQVLDYRRFLPHRAATDLAVVTIAPPDKSYRDLLLDLQISPIWFLSEECKTLAGKGTAWEALRTHYGL